MGRDVTPTNTFGTWGRAFESLHSDQPAECPALQGFFISANGCAKSPPTDSPIDWIVQPVGKPSVAIDATAFRRSQWPQVSKHWHKRRSRIRTVHRPTQRRRL